MFGTHYYKIASIPNAVMGGGLEYIMVYLLWLKFMTAANRSPFQRRAARTRKRPRWEDHSHIAVFGKTEEALFVCDLMSADEGRCENNQLQCQ